MSTSVVCSIAYPAVCTYGILYYVILYYTILYYTILYYTILYYALQYNAIIYNTIHYYTTLLCTTAYHTIPYHTVYTVPYCSISISMTYSSFSVQLLARESPELFELLDEYKAKVLLFMWGPSRLLRDYPVWAAVFCLSRFLVCCFCL